MMLYMHQHYIIEIFYLHDIYIQNIWENCLYILNIKLILWQFQKSYRQNNFTPNHQHFCFIFYNKVYNDTYNNDKKRTKHHSAHYIQYIYILVILICFKLFVYIPRIFNSIYVYFIYIVLLFSFIKIYTWMVLEKYKCYTKS